MGVGRGVMDGPSMGWGRPLAKVKVKVKGRPRGGEIRENDVVKAVSVGTGVHRTGVGSWNQCRTGLEKNKEKEVEWSPSPLSPPICFSLSH